MEEGNRVGMTGDKVKGGKVSCPIDPALNTDSTFRNHHDNQCTIPVRPIALRLAVTIASHDHARLGLAVSWSGLVVQVFLSSKRPANQVGNLISLFANDTGPPSVLLVSYKLSGHRGSHRQPFDECSQSRKVATFRLMLTGLAFLVLIKMILSPQHAHCPTR